MKINKMKFERVDYYFTYTTNGTIYYGYKVCFWNSEKEDRTPFVQCQISYSNGSHVVKLLNLNLHSIDEVTNEFAATVFNSFINGTFSGVGA